MLWTCSDVGNSDFERKGYYLQFSNSASTDINSADLRRILIQIHLLYEASLKELSTEALLELLAPVFLGGGEFDDLSRITGCASLNHLRGW